ncbi:MAG: hypothetical protein QOE70_569 [Chthoniobacter sp.]|jgi:uncharacterized membrane protein|nr:hypothetical protein [Chthoniobacter sp.]
MNPNSYSSQKNIRPHGLTRWAVSAAVALASLPAADAQPRYALTELPTPAGYELSVPYHINDQGLVAGSSTRPNDANGLVATVWKSGTVSLLGRLKNGTYSTANAINSKGVVAGEGDDGDGRPLGWVTSGSNLVNFFSNNGGNTRPVAINDAGDISGYYIKSGSAAWRGAIWKVDAKDPRKSTKIDLPILPGGDALSASAISSAFNKSNEAAGWAANSAIGQHAAFWKNDATHTIVDLGVFGSDWSSVAYALSDLGQVVGSSHPPFGSRPVLWHNDPAHTAYELPLLPGHNYGSASLINNNTTIIGFSAAGEPGTWNVGPSQIVIWIDGVVYDLQSLLVPSAAGWTIHEIKSMNNPGQLAGFASRNGVTRAVILTPIP